MKVEVKVIGRGYVFQVVESEFEGVVDGKPVSEGHVLLLAQNTKKKKERSSNSLKLLFISCFE